MKILPGGVRRRLSFANVTSCLALFVALGGTSYAALKLPANSVGTREIKTGGVGNTEIKANGVRKWEIASSAVGKAEIATSAVGQSEIGDDAVGLRELRANSVGTSEITDGAIAPTDLSATAKTALGVARAAVTKAGSNAGGNATTVTRTAAGSYAVTFDHDVSKCQIAATLAAVPNGTATDTPDPGRITAGPGTSANQIAVKTYFGAEDATTHMPPAVDEPFHVLVAC
jgi:hypothetical protein